MNRNKLIDLFISNLSNVIIHKVLEKAIDKPEIAGVYNKEVKNSLNIATKYREKINPLDKILPVQDTKEIRDKIIRKVNSELNLRISKGYTNINLDLVEDFVDKLLKDLKII